MAIFSQDNENPGFQGVGFSIPSNDVKDALLQILERGRPIRGFLGIQMRDLDPAVRNALGYQDADGAAILGIAPGSPAQAAGLQPWDVVRSLNGEAIHSSAQLFSLIQRAKVGEPVALDVWREGRLLKIKAVVAESGSTASSAGPSAAPTESNRKLDPEEVLKQMGIEVRDLSVPERLRGYRGVVVTRVSENGLAAEQVKSGDLIVAVNQSRVNEANEFLLQLTASAGVQDTSLHMMRDGQRLVVTLPALSPAE